jgi:SAM-dependent methyltransferase
VAFYNACVAGAAQVLDIGCGSGRMAIPIARAGVMVHAVDRSARVLRYFRAKLAKSDVRWRITVSSLDIREKPYRQHVDAAIAADDFLTHFLSEEELRAVLANVRGSLHEGGRFFTDLRGKTEARLREAAAPLPRPMQCFGIASGALRSAVMQSLETYDEPRRILRSDQRYDIIRPDGDVERTFYRTIRQRLWRIDEIANLAEGFAVEAGGRYGREGAEGASMVMIAK